MRSMISSVIEGAEVSAMVFCPKTCLGAFLVLGICLLGNPVLGAETSSASIGAERGSADMVPKDVSRAMVSQGLTKAYSFSFHLKPFFLQGDFNGDGKADKAVLIKQTATGKFGIAIIHGGSKEVSILGAGKTFGNGGDDFSWMDHWDLFSKSSVGQGVGENAPPILKGDAIFVEKTESASALIYWDGKQYQWYQQGD
jgi:hypothetical protein